jgi:alpha-beta hydrolase superfamily lysophospholipase
VVLVAHSMGGLSLSLAMERYSHKIGLAIFVAAVVNASGKGLSDGPLYDMVRVLIPRSFLLRRCCRSDRVT